MSHTLVKQLQVVLLYLILPPYLSGLFQFMSIPILYQASRNKEEEKNENRAVCSHLTSASLLLQYNVRVSLSEQCMQNKSLVWTFSCSQHQHTSVSLSEAVIRRGSRSISTLCRQVKLLTEKMLAENSRDSPARFSTI